jgi:glycine/D-amino acid oxidase-like deaminating enzyme
LGGLRAKFRASEATASPEPTPEVQAALDAYLAEHIPFARGAEVEHRWAGTMGFSADGLPLVGELRPRVHLLAGFTGHGLGTALALAGVLSRALTSDTGAHDRLLLAALSPRRTPLRVEGD